VYQYFLKGFEITTLAAQNNEAVDCLLYFHPGVHKMTLTAVILLSISALTHAGWNLISKKDTPSTASFLLANLFGTLLLIPLMLFGKHQIIDMILLLWPLLLITGFFQATYFTGLAYAYKTGELSVAYPLARSAPSLMVATVVLMAGQGGKIGNLALLGMTLIVLGGFLIPLKSFRDFSLQRYRSVAVVTALIAAAGTAGYSMIDDYALALLRDSSSTSPDNFVIVALYYIALQGVMTVIWQGLTVLLIREERRILCRRAAHPGSSIIKGAGIFLTYSLVLISMGYVSNVSYVVAFRQLSIPIGLVFGIFFLKERVCGPKLTAVILLFTGVVLVGIG
jgi:drug/metabolite transporter (DMT)-like permease